MIVPSETQKELVLFEGSLKDYAEKLLKEIDLGTTKNGA